MYKPYYFLSLLLIALSTMNVQADVTKPIVPPMVSIPAGSFAMGTLGGDPATQPQHTVNVMPFKIGQYPITVVEFRRFVVDTGFNTPSTCNDFFDKEGLRGPTLVGSGRWDSHRYSFSDYQPVTCITVETARAYANWLSQKTGIAFRLPTEQEWEYAAKGNTSTRFFWGNDFDEKLACQYGNVADYTGEYTNNNLYGYSNLGFIEIANCDDGEAYNSIVGMYRPNPFGLYDISGNVLEFTDSCYRSEGYKLDESERIDAEECDFYTVKGGSWHYPAKPHSFRGRVKKEGWNVSADIGFRLVTSDLDTPNLSSTDKFLTLLKKEQSARIANRDSLLQPVQQALVQYSVSGEPTLVWQKSADPDITHYIIYRAKYPESHRMGGFFKDNYVRHTEIDATQNMLLLQSDKEMYSVRIVAVSHNRESLPSEPILVVKNATKPVLLPSILTVDQATHIENVKMRYINPTADNPGRYFLFKTHSVTAQDTVIVRFVVNVEKSGRYQFNYAGRSFQPGVFFNLWSENTLLAKVDYSTDIDDRTSKRVIVDVKQGIQTIELQISRAGFDRWSLTWISFTETSDEQINAPNKTRL